MPARPPGSTTLGRSGARASRQGLGCAPLGNLYRAVSDEDAHATLAAAWAAGVRYFDTAPLYGYGLSERRTGTFLREQPRDDFAIATKVGRRLVALGEPRSDDIFADAPPLEAVFDYTHDGVLRSVEASLERLGVDRVDVLLVHDLGTLTHGAAHPERLAEAMQGAFPALARLREEGTTRAVGLGVNETAICEEVLAHTDLDCVLLAGRYTLLEQDALTSFLPLCVTRGVSVIVGAPFNSGLLVDPSAASATYDYGAPPEDIRERALRIQRVCEDHGVPLPAAALQLPLLHPAVASVIPGARGAEEVGACSAWLAHPIPAALFDALRAEGLLRPDAPTTRSPA